MFGVREIQQCINLVSSVNHKIIVHVHMVVLYLNCINYEYPSSWYSISVSKVLLNFGPSPIGYRVTQLLIVSNIAGVNILQKSVNSAGTVFSYTKNSTVTKLSNFNFVFRLPQIYLVKDSVLTLWIQRKLMSNYLNPF